MFERWDDSRRTTWPGGPERTDDVVAILRRLDVPEAIAYLIIECETEPRKDSLHRVGLYELFLSREVLTETEDSPIVGSLILRLTGVEPSRKPNLGIPGTSVGSRIEPVEIFLAKESASDNLEEIAAGKWDPCVLIWVPLMAGAGTPEVAERWKQVVTAREPNVELRILYRDMALVFAELTKGLVIWQRALEGWMMKESMYVNSWLERGELRGILMSRRAVLRDLLVERLHNSVPEAINLAIEGTNDTAILDRWIKATLTLGSYAEFQNLMQQG